MKTTSTIILRLSLLFVANVATFAQPIPGGVTTAADRAYYAQQEQKQKEAAAREAEAATNAERQKVEVIVVDTTSPVVDQLLALRTQQAYPNNPAMWQWLYNNPSQIGRYLGDPSR